MAVAVERKTTTMRTRRSGMKVKVGVGFWKKGPMLGIVMKKGAEAWGYLEQPEAATSAILA